MAIGKCPACGTQCPECEARFKLYRRDMYEKMRKWRISNKMDVDDAARAVGCTTEAWQDWEFSGPMSEVWSERIYEVISVPYEKKVVSNGAVD